MRFLRLWLTNCAVDLNTVDMSAAMEFNFRNVYFVSLDIYKVYIVSLKISVCNTMYDFERKNQMALVIIRLCGLKLVCIGKGCIVRFSKIKYEFFSRMNRLPSL